MDIALRVDTVTVVRLVVVADAATDVFLVAAVDIVTAAADVDVDASAVGVKCAYCNEST